MTEEFKTIKVHLEDQNEAAALLGNSDTNIKIIEDELNVSIVTRGESISVSGNEESVELVGEIFENLLYCVRKGINISGRDVSYAIQMAKKGALDYFKEIYEGEITKTAKGKSIRVKTLGQKHYISAMNKNDLVFCIWPCRNRKNISRCCNGSYGFKKRKCEKNYSYPSGC